MWYKIFTFTFLLFCLNAMAIKIAGVYGTDDRSLLKDVCGDAVFTTSDYKGLGHSVCAIVKKSSICELWESGTGSVPYPKNGCNLRLYGQLRDWVDAATPGTEKACSDLKFASEYVADGLKGTGVCIGERSILTAQHLFYENGVEQNPADFVVIFNWMDNNFLKDGTACFGVPNAKNIGPYYYLRIIGYDTDSKTTMPLKKIGGRDICILKTDRIIDQNIVALNMFTGDDLKKAIAENELFTIGHPNGLPLVIAQKAKINAKVTFDSAYKKVDCGGAFPPRPSLTQDQFDHLLACNFDSFGGNSGGPVFVKDRNFKWTVIGIIGGGTHGYALSSIGCLTEYITPDADFESGTSFGWFWTLQHINFNRSCGLDCPEIKIQEKYDEGTVIPPNPTVRGQTITVTLPTGTFTEGVYLVKFSETIGYVVVRWGGEWSQRTVSRVIPNGQSYNVALLFNREGSQQVYSFGVSGVANGTVLADNHQIENNLSKQGINTSTFCFVPNMKTGTLPLLVNFVPNIPNNQPIATWNWNFGDGTTGSEMYPSHIYTKAGLYTVSVQATPVTGTNLSYTFPNCINVDGIVSNSLLNQQSISSSNELYIQNVNTAGQTGATTCSSPKKIIILPETVLQKGSNVILKIQ